VYTLPAWRVFRQTLLIAALLDWAVPGIAADAAGAVAPAHGPMLMLYVTQPLFERGANRVYGLRLDQAVPQAITQPTQSSLYASSPHRSLVDLQIRRRADIRVEFGSRVTWNVQGRELDLTSNRGIKPIDFPAH